MALSAVLFTGLSLGLTSCGDDNDEPRGEDYPLFDNTRLTRLGDLVLSYDDEGRVESVTGGRVYWNLDYKEGVITSNTFTDQDGIRMKFNGKGYITSLESDWDYVDELDDDESEHCKGSGRMTFAYDGNGNLISSKYESDDVVQNLQTGQTWKYRDDIDISLTWHKGNLQRVVREETETETGSPTYRDIETYEYDCDGRDNTFRQMPLSLTVGVFDDDMTIWTALACAGMFGNGSSQLPTRFVVTDDDGDSDVVTISFRLNDNGSIAAESIDGEICLYDYSAASRSELSGQKPVRAAGLRDFARHSRLK